MTEATMRIRLYDETGFSDSQLLGSQQLVGHVFCEHCKILFTGLRGAALAHFCSGQIRREHPVQYARYVFTHELDNKEPGGFQRCASLYIARTFEAS